MTAPADVLSVLLDALADRIAARITTTTERETYDSRNLPPRTTRRRFAEVCRSGRVLDARREGRDWKCSRAAWEAARSRRTPAPAATPSTTGDLNARAGELLTRSGLRVVRGAR
jgi:hypothetical protein